METEGATAMTGVGEETLRQALVVVHQTVGNNAERVVQAERDRDDLVEFMTPVAKQDVFVSAAFHGKVSLVVRLLEAGADKDGRASEALAGVGLVGYTALAAACREGHPQVVKLLLEAGAAVEKANTHGANRGMTPLMFAAAYGSVACLERLLEAPGVDVNAQDPHSGCTALHYASCESCVRLLLNAKADKDAQDAGGQTPLRCAVSRIGKNIIKMLLDAGCNVNLARRNGTTPLMAAATYNLPDIVEMLIEAGAIKSLVNGRGETASQLAAKKGHDEVVALLRDE